MSVQSSVGVVSEAEEQQLVEQVYYEFFEFVPDEIKVNITGESTKEKDAIRWRLGGSTRGYYQKKRMVPYVPTVFDFDEIQAAFVEGIISIEQFTEILIANFGKKKAMKILRHNLKLARKEENLARLRTNPM